MFYRKIGKLNEEISLLGIGAMRLPTDIEGAIDKASSVAMIRKAIDGGVNYIDTAFTYPGSEKIVGAALKDGYREKTYIADKLPPWLIRSEEDKESLFNKSFERLGVDCIDFFLIHNLNKGNWRKTQKWDLINFLSQKKAEGKIRHLGFSFHGDLELFKEIVDAHDWDFCQIQLNFMDKNMQAGIEGLDYAYEKGLGVIIMEPLKGGRLTTSIPPTVQKLWDSAPSDKSPVEWSFKWLMSHPKISLILSGTSNEDQLEDNIRIFSDPSNTSITAEEEELLDKVSAEYKRLVKYSCTGCGYCMPCPQKLDIPTILGYFNDWNAFDKPSNVKFEYDGWLVKHGSDCVDCHACEEKCPQSLPIAQAMKEAAEVFGH